MDDWISRERRVVKHILSDDRDIALVNKKDNELMHTPLKIAIKWNSDLSLIKLLILPFIFDI